MSANASDDVSVAGVQFRLDGVNLGAEDTSSPYSVSWDTTTVGNGSHTLTAVARDGPGLTTTSAPVTVTVTNAAPPAGATRLGSAQSGDNGSSPSLVFNLPTMQAGDQILVGVQTSNDTSFTIPSGWTVVSDFRPTTSWHPRVVVLRRAAVAGETTVTIPTGHIGKTGVAIAYRGLDPTSPVIATTTASVDSTTLTVPGITPGVSGARLAYFTGAQGHSTPTGWSPPAGMTEVGDTNTLQWISIAGHEQLLTSGAATGSRSAVFGGSLSLSGVLVALRPASGPPNTPPTVSITQPGNNATVSGTTTVSANASDDTGVAGVQFKVDGANIGPEDTSSPYSITWDTTAVGNGQHTITAVARDSASQTTTSAPVTVTVNNVAPNQPPTVSVTQPANNATVSGTATVSANANDDVGVAGVQFKLDGANLGVEDTSAPFTLQWDTTTIANGQHTLTAVARDGPGLTTTSSAITVTVSNGAPNQPPTVTLTAPANGATVSGTITVAANAADDVSVAGIQFRLDGANLGLEDTSSPYSVSWDTTSVANGTHTLTAVARDGPGLSTTSAVVTVTVSNAAPNQPPSVTLTAPANGATVSGTISVTANASDDVSVAGVQFKLDGANLGSEDTSSPYSVSWNTTTVSNGSHTLTAVARDGPGLTTTTAPVTVTVSNGAPNQPPTVTVTAPAGGSTVSATISVTANASDDVSVAGVQFKLDGANLGTEDTSSAVLGLLGHHHGLERLAHTGRRRTRRPGPDHNEHAGDGDGLERSPALRPRARVQLPGDGRDRERPVGQRQQRHGLGRDLDRERKVRSRAELRRNE